MKTKPKRILVQLKAEQHSKGIHYSSTPPFYITFLSRLGARFAHRVKPDGTLTRRARTSVPNVKSDTTTTRKVCYLIYHLATVYLLIFVQSNIGASLPRVAVLSPKLWQFKCTVINYISGSKSTY